jgi:hypothetical protein
LPVHNVGLVLDVGIAVAVIVGLRVGYTIEGNEVVVRLKDLVGDQVCHLLMVGLGDFTGLLVSVVGFIV